MINSTKIMMEEHQNILRMVRVIRNACYQVMKTGKMNYEDFAQMIDFIRTYADEHHHGKEEKILFEKMQQNLGRMGENLITHGMLVEHDLGRLHIQELEQAIKRVKEGEEESLLDVIADAISYTHLIERHIKKEDELIYPFGEKQLSAEIIKEVEEKTEEFERNAINAKVQEKYLNLLENLEKVYV